MTLEYFVEYDLRFVRPWTVKMNLEEHGEVSLICYRTEDEAIEMLGKLRTTEERT